MGHNEVPFSTGKCGSLYYKDGKLVEEVTEGLGWLRFLYGGRCGRLLRRLLRRRLSARLYAQWQNSSLSKRAIEPFVKRHSINMDESERSLDHFTSFNDFFIRKLKPAARPIDTNKNGVISPCDGKVILIPDASLAHHFFVKDTSFSLASLFADNTKASLFAGGTLLLFRLAPYDYHRFHFPIDGLLRSLSPIKGMLESVNPIAYNGGVQPLVVNERHVAMIESDIFGPVAYFMIGAMFVGTINYTNALPSRTYKRGDECGYFSFGGSSLLLLFKPGVIDVRQDIKTYSAHGYETAVRMGEVLAYKKDLGGTHGFYQ